MKNAGRVLSRATPPIAIVIASEAYLSESPGNKLHDWMWILATIAAIVSHVIITGDKR